MITVIRIKNTGSVQIAFLFGKWEKCSSYVINADILYDGRIQSMPK